ncbi:hypothetical protein CHGG_00415 [Chaetomium globosum CBS 148.51]|uniref:Swiss Army Knife RNA repair protein HAD domain-containing protein n=1 Tax=Chaetomium globosum (strain ATCC 6205 / CBS 148.51 / DSM 1962 / NBRC 6347 / NRRL 1970) TaxID=306901 RepID=Q2HH89_CHAGB|nr:uncharacterized protein CHGG_00415 [Chaetomium globosum CBS 148.51]EAQ92180.1 hypothetical protein CHGG_00415 [Chaetomium globosum CBS 148.51]
MGSTAYAAYKNGAANASSAHTVTAMSRWSVLDKQLPPIDRIRAIHVYDFDNTLFKTPLPNPKLWNGPTIGMLSNPDAFVNGGWWHDSRILAATGEGLAKEEPRAWDGWWNEKIVELIHLSNKQKDAVCVLLTGRSESGFGELIKRMVKSKGLEFDLISLKPSVGPNNERITNTMVFKQIFLEALMETYKHAEEIRIYEDRIKHVKGFRDFLDEYNIRKLNGMEGAPTRGTINGEVIQVVDIATFLDPIVEVAEVQQIITDHNAALSKRRRGSKGERFAIKKTVFYTGYMINNADTQRLLTLAQTPQNLSEGDIKFHANNIMICPRPCPPGILEKVGGMGNKMTWEVTGTANLENSIWAVCVKPVPATAKFHTGDPVPLVVLALRKGARHAEAGKIQKWQPVTPDKAFRFETTVGEKILLRIESDGPSQHGPAGRALNKRKHTAGQDDFRARPSGAIQQQQQQQQQHPQQQQQHRQFHHQGNFAGSAGGGGGGGGRGGAGRGNFRGGGGAGRGNKGQRGGAAKGRGGRGGHGGGGHHYKSLDDVGGRDSQGGFAQMYEDEPHTRFQNQNIPKGPSNPGNPGFYGGGGGGGGGGQQQQQQQQQQFGRPGNNQPGGGAGGGVSELNNYY